MGMHRNFAILVVVLLLAVGLPVYMAAAQTENEPALLAGEVWGRGDGLGYNVSLILGENGRYVARWVGCVGEYGRAEGMWSDVDGGVELRPSREEGMMRGHLKRLERVSLNGEMRLVPPEDIAEVQSMKVGEPFISFLAFKKEARDL
ncbi:MAG TPA: hypothetical protein VIU34_37065 [Steroidobacter sp.]